MTDSTVPGTRFGEDGVCNYCRMHDELERRFPLNETGEKEMNALLEKIRAAGKGKRYDCAVGFSGGRDTSYCLYMVKKLGLRPLVVHFDNGWDSEIAKTNTKKLCDKLNADLHTEIADWEESRELTNCTIRSGVPYVDLTDDIGMAGTLYRAAAREGIRYVILSHSFRMEGINPLKWNYVDARYARALIRRFGRMKFKKFRNVDLHHLLYWMLFKRIRVVNLTNYYDDRAGVEDFLRKEFGWIDTGGHHYDNEIFALVCDYARRKFGFDFRVIEFSAWVRSGLLTRGEALEKLKTPPPHEAPELVDYCLRKQGISREEYHALIAGEKKYFTDYPSYYPLLKLLRLPIKLLCRLDVLPFHLYEKYFLSI